MMDVFLTYVGCRLNESEIEEMASRFTVRGHTVVRDPAQADVCVVNTCTVTGEAGRKSRQAVRRLARLHPDARIAVTGCHATVASDELALLPNVDWVVKNADKDRLVEVVAASDEVNLITLRQTKRFHGPGMMGRTRAFIKVQDGCDNRCTFCVTTIARGAGRSRAIDRIVADVQRLVAEGYREVVLSGVNLGSYGRDSGEADGLYRLVTALLAETKVPRLRLSSLEPWDISPAFFDLWTDSRLCRQLHLPAQSGCNATLRRMARRTTAESFAELVATARARIPDLALTTDIIVGFPGETEQAFEESYRFVETLQFARIHVFSYSPRPGTVAARMSDQVPARVKADRSRAIRGLGQRHARRFHRMFVGRSLPVLWEMSKDDSIWHGLTDNYLNVRTANTADLANRITETQLIKLRDDGLWGEVI